MMPFLSPNGCFDRPSSASDVGQDMNMYCRMSADHYRGSLTLGSSWRSTVSELCDLAEECTRQGWDGHGAPPLCFEAFENAAKFISSIPLDVPTPEISATAAGDITFQWSQNGTRIVTVAVSPNSKLHFAYLNGSKRHFGSMPLIGEFDKPLLSLISEAIG